MDFDLLASASSKKRKVNRIRPPESPQHARHARNKYKLQREDGFREGLHTYIYDEHPNAGVCALI